MQGKAQTCLVKNGRIRVICARCAKKKYIAVIVGVRKKTVRCTCGLSTLYTLNHRGAARESTCGKAQIILQSGRMCPVYLCDMSPSGIGFNIPRQYSRSVTNGQDISIKYRSQGGATVQRKIRVKDIANNRVGAQFLDGYISSFE